MQWIYGEKIFSRASEENTEDEPLYSEIDLLVNSYVFGEKIQDESFRDAVIDSMIVSINTLGKEKKSWYPSGSAVDRAYEGTPEGKPLRKLMVDIYAHRGKPTIARLVQEYQILKDLAGELFVGREDYLHPDPTGIHRKSCQYHHHGKDQSR